MYIYLGSANGYGGIKARLGRHVSGKPLQKHWHIDYLRCLAHPTAYSYISNGSVNPPRKPIECCWSQMLASHSKMHMPALGFGASDCNYGCKSHLLFYAQPDLENSKPRSTILKLPSFLLDLAFAINAPADEIFENTYLIAE